MRARFIFGRSWAAELVREKGGLREADHGWSLYCDSRTAVEPHQHSGSLHHLDRTGVLRHQGVDGQQRNPLDSRLCH